MAQTLVPLKVKIGLRENGHADHPDWTKVALPSGGKPEDYMVGGWKYDKSSGHQEETVDSPRGMQWGMILVTPEFATNAIKQFPSTISKMTEVEAETFYDNKVTIRIAEDKLDYRELSGLKALIDLKKEVGAPQEEIDAIKTKIAKAIDPNDSSPGVIKSVDKKWTDYKSSIGVTIAK